MVHGFECNACKCVDNIYQMHWIKNAPNSPHFQYSVLISYYDEILNFVPPIEISITYLSSFLCLFFLKWFKFILYVLILLYESKINRLWAQYFCSKLSFFLCTHATRTHSYYFERINFQYFFFSHFCGFFGINASLILSKSKKNTQSLSFEECSSPIFALVLRFTSFASI